MTAGRSFEQVLERTSSAASQADWRLLPGVPESGSALVLATSGDRIADALAIVFEEVLAVNADGVQEAVERSSAVSPPGAVEILDGRGGLPDLSQRAFDLVACPEGLPRALLSGPIHEILDGLHSLLRPGGALVLGLPSILRSLTRTARFGSGRVPFLRRRLTRAGFDAVGTHLVLPHPLAPNLLAPTTGSAASFALGLHAAARLPWPLRRGLRHPLGAAAAGILFVDHVLVARRAPPASQGDVRC
jgi:hypothetical protein